MSLIIAQVKVEYTGEAVCVRWTIPENSQRLDLPAGRGVWADVVGGGPGHEELREASCAAIRVGCQRVRDHFQRAWWNITEPLF